MSKCETQPMNDWNVINEERQPSSDFLHGMHADLFHLEALQAEAVVFEMNHPIQTGREVVQSQAMKEKVAA